MWIARNYNGVLLMFNEKPYISTVKRVFGIPYHWVSDSNDYMRLKDGMFPGITFENSPVEIEITIKK